MKKEKDFYTSPEVETLELRIEGIICQSGEFDPDNWNSGEDDWFPLS